MNISVVSPIESAIRRTKLVLFGPFNFEKWLKLGFCAFLAMLGRGGGFPNFSRGISPGTANNIEAWIKSHLPLFITLVAAVLLLAFALGLLVTWLACRGRFMFIDGIVRNRGAVVEPWREFRAEGNRLFWFLVLFGLACLPVTLLIAGLGVGLAWPDIQAGHFGGWALLGVLVGGGMLLVFAVAAGVFGWLIEAFVVPTMYLHRVGVLEGWSIVRREIISGRAGTVILYLLMTIVVGIAVGMLMVAVTCMTCCIAALPYVGSVILLPLLVFLRAYQLCFLEQFGPAWMFFSPPPWPGACAQCGYDLRGLPPGAVCPECGTPMPPHTPPDFGPVAK